MILVSLATKKVLLKQKVGGCSVRFAPDSSSLLVAGKSSLLVLSCQNSEILKKWSTVKHEAPIQKVEWLGDDILSTLCQNKEVRLWRVNGDNAALFAQCKLQSQPTQMSYCPRNQLLGFMDGQCSVTMIPVK